MLMVKGECWTTLVNQFSRTGLDLYTGSYARPYEDVRFSFSISVSPSTLIHLFVQPTPQKPSLLPSLSERRRKPSRLTFYLRRRRTSRTQRKNSSLQSPVVQV